MTTVNDDLEDRISTLGPVVLEQGRDRSLTGDPTGTYPKFPDWYTSSLPKTSYGAELTTLNLGGGLNGIDVTSSTPSNSMNTRNRAIKTASGHTFEMDDTPGNERIILGHNSGNGIEFKSDGSMVIVSGSQTIQVSSDQKIIIEGNVTIAYGGNVDMEVAGDFNLKIGGSYNVEIGENKNESISGSWRSTTEGNVGHIVKGNSSATTLGTSTSTVLGDNNNVTKGASRITSEGDMRLSSGATSYISSKGKMYQSSNNMNIAASDLSVFGATGTIGGSGVVMYSKGATFSQGVTAPTFHGDLDGNAANTYAQSYGEAATSGGGPITNTSTPTTALPTSAILNEYLNQTSLGAMDVKVDIGDHMLRAINRSSATSGISTKDLKTTEVRAFMRSESVRNDPLFVQNAVSTGKLSPTYSQNTPMPVSRVNSSNQEPFRGSTSLGTRGPNGDQKFIAPDIKTFNFVPDSKISNSDNITLGTQIIKSVPLSTFTGGKGSIGRLSEIPLASRAQIARNLQPHAELLKRIRLNRDSAFRENRLVVIEGLYKPRDIELSSSDWSTSVNRYKSEGRAVVYELHNTQGKADLEKTYDLAVHLKTVGSFQKLILDYDTYNPDGSMNVQLIVVTPALSESYTVTDGNWSKEVVTLYNNTPLSNTDLIEMKPEDISTFTPNTRYSGNPENLDSKFKSEEELLNWLRANKNTASSNGYTFVYGGSQYWWTVNPYNLKNPTIGGAFFLSDNFTDYRENQALSGPLAGRNETGIQAYNQLGF